MMEEILKQFNPWWVKEYRAPGIPRPDYIRKIDDALARQNVAILYGLRRVGKTTIMRQFVARALSELPPERIYFASMDHPTLERTSIIELLREFRRITSARTDEEVLLLLDEVQHRDGFEREIKAIVDMDEKIHIIASGSSSIAIGHATPYLTGRYTRVPVRPLSFREFLSFRSLEYMEHEPQLMEALMDDYLISGGMPKYVMTGDPQIITELIEDVIYKDICSRYEVHDPKLLKELYYLLMVRVGKPLSFRRMGRLIDVGVDTVRRYVGYFEEAYLLEVIGRDGSPNVRKASPRKCYAPDTGIRTVIAGESNIGSLAENAVYLKLREEGEVRYLLDRDREIDFLVGGKAVEVKYWDELKKEQISSLAQYKGRRVKDKYVVTRRNGPDIGSVNRIPLWRFLGGKVES